MSPRRWQTIGPLLAGVPVVVLLLAPWQASAAAACTVMTVRNTVGTGTALAIQPDHVDIAYRGCVQFTNKSIATVTITVGSHYSHDVPAGGSTSGQSNYVGTTAGKQTVTAMTGPTQAQGSITVRAAPSPSPSRSTSATPPPPSSSPRPSSSGTGPQVAPTPSPTPPIVGGLPPPRRPTAPPGPPSGSPTPTLSSATPAPAATSAQGGPIEPGSGRGVGLPAALAAIAIVGTGAGLVRVLLAEPDGPVDSGRTVRGGA